MHTQLLLFFVTAGFGLAYGAGGPNPWAYTIQATDRCSSYNLKADDDDAYTVFLYANFSATRPDIVYSLRDGDKNRKLVHLTFRSKFRCTDDGPCMLPITIVNVAELWINFQKDNTSPVIITAVKRSGKCDNLPALAIIVIVMIPFATFAFMALLCYKCCKRHSTQKMELQRIKLMQGMTPPAQNLNAPSQALLQPVYQLDPVASFAPPPPVYQQKLPL